MQEGAELTLIGSGLDSIGIMVRVLSTEGLKVTLEIERHLPSDTLREGMQADMLAEMKALSRRSDEQLVALLVQAIRESGIAWRLVYTLLARQTSPELANEAFQDAKAKAGASLTRTIKGERT